MTRIRVIEKLFTKTFNFRFDTQYIFSNYYLTIKNNSWPKKTIKNNQPHNYEIDYLKNVYFILSKYGGIKTKFWKPRVLKFKETMFSTCFFFFKLMHITHVHVYV